MDETYIKVKGKWNYLYRAVDKFGNTIDFKLSKKRDEAAARKFFQKAINHNAVPERVVIDKSGANLAGLEKLNAKLKFTNAGKLIEVLQVKYLNRCTARQTCLPESEYCRTSLSLLCFANNCRLIDHRFIKRIVRPMLGFKAFHSAAATLAGIEIAHMIRKGQLPTNTGTGFQHFAELAG